jgi:hypothetical protein
MLLFAAAAAKACVNPFCSRSSAMMRFECIDRYDGEWLDGMQHGEGVTSTAQGEVSCPVPDPKQCCAVQCAN